MNPSDQLSGAERPLDNEYGRIAPAEVLRLHLMTAPEEFVCGAAENPAMGTREWIALLRNRNTPTRVLRRLADDRTVTASQEVRKLLVLHPRTPLITARRFLPFLFWKDLVELTLAPVAPPQVQRQAERKLRGRLGEMAVGERVALARRAGRGLIPALAESPDDRVLRSLLDNPRTTEAEVVRIAGRESVPAGTLGHLALHYRWCNRRSVRLALISNRATPPHAALALVARLDRNDLQRTANSDKVPQFVRIGADRHLQRTSTARPASRPRPGSP